MKQNKLIISLIAIFLSFNSSVGFAMYGTDGNSLLNDCKYFLSPKTMKVENYIGSGFCAGLMNGITNLNKAYELLDGKNLFCLPKKGIKNGQAARIVIKYMEDHPKDLHEQGASLSILAFMEAYPCK